MRGLVRRLGLVTRGELRAAEDKIRTMRQRLEAMAERLAQATSASEQLQQARREETQRYKARLEEVESDHARRAARADEAAARAARRIDALEAQLRTRDAELEAAGREETRLEQEVAAAMRDLQIARETLAVVEVKLDILEGAANVLDHRARAGRGID
jgi:chromosome segregation ATPase